MFSSLCWVCLIVSFLGSSVAFKCIFVSFWGFCPLLRSQKSHTVARFPSVSWGPYHVGGFTALFIVTSLGRHRGVAVFAFIFFWNVRLQEAATAQSRSQVFSRARSSQGWRFCWGGVVALRLVIRRVLLFIAHVFHFGSVIQRFGSGFFLFLSSLNLFGLQREVSPV